MSWKSTSSPCSFFKKLSITGRLTLLYILSAVITLLGGITYITWSMYQVMEQADSDFVQARLQTYRALFSDRPGDLETIRKDIEWEGTNVATPEYYIRIEDSSGRLLVETPGMSQVLPSSLFHCVLTHPRQITTRYLHAANGREYLISCDLEPVGHPKGGIIQIGLDATHEIKAIRKKQVQLVIIFISGIVAATGVGVLVARKALSPLRDITGVAKQITVERISERLDPLQWPVELRHFASAFNEMLGRLEESFIKLSQSSSNLAHELRTPINNLLGVTEVALTRDRPPEEYRKTLESNVEEYHRLSRLIDDMLFLARADHPTQRFKFVLFDPAKEIEKVCAFYEPVAEDKGIAISYSGSGLMYGAPQMLERAVSNLVGNALQYSPPGCVVEVRTLTTGDGSQVVQVRDSGHGMKPEEVDRVFDRFYRGDRHRTLHPDGSGLGLSIVKSIVELHHGTISVESSPNHGTTILLRFPPPPPDA
ncbi:heavy metal sensor histidine kinase [Geomonas ferrireducens]|uniref:heavy metal sensor histidine kinase n=1 Tax=Geomonas ferrireducens TaxID=2570227 RepID=UPI0010A88D5D|nr:heavy metal sensor histidine kinase [Geomonas ferrireducens]